MHPRTPWLAYSRPLLFSLTAFALTNLLSAADPVVTIDTLGNTTPMMSPSDNRAIIATEDGKHYAFLGGEGSRQQVIIDGIAGPAYTQAGSQYLVHYEMKSDPRYPERPKTRHNNQLTVAFMKGGTEAAYLAQREGNLHVVVAKEGIHTEWPALGQYQYAVLSPEKQYLYVLYSVRGEKYGSTSRMIINGAATPENVNVHYQPADMAFYEPDTGKPHYAYVGRSSTTINNRPADTYRVYIDGVPGPEFGRMNTQQNPLSFVEIDGKLAVAYTAMKYQERHSRAVIQNLDGTAYVSEPGVDPGTFRVSDDATKVAWLQTPVPDTSNRHNQPASIPVTLMVNGASQHEFEVSQTEVRNLGYSFRLSPDGSRWALERLVEGSTNYAKYIMVDGLRGPEYQMTEQSTFVPGSQRHYFVTRNGRSQFVVIDGIEHGPFNQITPIVSSDSGQSIAWHGTTDMGGAIYVNGNPVTSGNVNSPQLPISFRPGTEDYITIASEEDGLFLHIGNRKYRADSRGVSPPIFSEDGSRVALWGEFYPRPGQPASRILLDGEPLSNIREEIQTDERSWKGFSPDNQHFLSFATTSETGDSQNRQAGTLLVDGYDLGPLFYYHGPDARYPHFREDGRFSFYAIYNNEIRRVSVDLEAAVAFGEARAAAEAKGSGKELFTPDPTHKLSSIASVMVQDEDTIYAAAQGGEYGMGALYRVNKDGTDFQILHNFLGGGDHAQNPSSLVLGNDGYLYGTAGQNSFYMRRPQVAGALFRIRTDGTGYEVVKFYEYSNQTRTSPILECLAPDGKLLARGPVPNPGRSGTDGLLKIDPNSGEIETVYRANEYQEDGQTITKVLVPFDDGGDGYYYGFDARTLYRFKLDGNEPTPIHEFRGFPLDGEAVNEPPVFHGEWLYGMTRGGGKNRLGTIYRCKRDGSEYEVLVHQERDKNFIALAAGPAGVWGYRTEQAVVKGRQRRVPALERLDAPGTAPRILEDAQLSSTIWLDQYQGEPSLFSLSDRSLTVVSMDEEAATPPELSVEVVAAPPLRDATSANLSL